MRLIPLAAFLVLVLFACRRSQSPMGSPKPEIDIFLLDTFSVDVDETVTPAIVAVTDAVIAPQPYINNNEITGYSQATNTFIVHSAASERLKQLPSGGFAVTVDRVPVYFGLIRPPYLSSILFGSAIISTMQFEAGQILVEYPSLEGASHLLKLDKRNEPALLDALRKSGRLQ